MNRQLTITIGIPSVLFVIVGVLLNKYLDSVILITILALSLIGFSSLFIIKRELIIAPNKTNSFLGGAFSGFSAGLLGTGGAIRGLTMASFNLEKSVIIATSACIDLFIDTTRILVYFENGFIHREEIIYIPFLIGLAIIGSWIGKKILIKAPQEYFRRLTLFLIVGIGMITLLEIIFK